MGDSDVPYALQEAWGRISCVNQKTFREYGQPFYAEHPEKADGE